MKVDHRVKYIIFVLALAGVAVIIGLFFHMRIDERFAVFSFGVPLYIYLTLARAFHAGKIFNIVLLCSVITSYLAVLLAPMYFLFRSFDWPVLILQAGLIIFHFMLGMMLIIKLAHS